MNNDEENREPRNADDKDKSSGDPPRAPDPDAQKILSIMQAFPFMFGLTVPMDFMSPIGRSLGSPATLGAFLDDAAAAAARAPEDKAGLSTADSRNPAAELRAPRDVFRAAKRGDIFAVLRALEDKTVTVDARKHEARPGSLLARTLLQVAAKYDHIALVQHLLARGADVDAISRNGLTATHFATMFGHDIVLGVLLDAGADPARVDEDGNSPLHIAAVNGHAAAVSRIMASVRANVLAVTKLGLTAMHLAVSAGHASVVQLLCVRKALVELMTPDGLTPLMIATCAGSAECARPLLEAGASPERRDPDGRQMLHFAARADDPETLILALGADVCVDSTDACGHTALHFAASARGLACVMLLLERGANINARDRKGKTPLYLAAKRDADDIIRALLSAGADHAIPSHKNVFPIHIAACKKNSAAVVALATTKEAVSHRLAGGWTALHVACRCGDDAAVCALLRAGADHNAVKDDGWTPMRLAISNGYRRVVSALLKAGAVPDDESSGAFTRLMSGDYDEVAFLGPDLHRAFMESILRGLAAAPRTSALRSAIAAAIPGLMQAHTRGQAECPYANVLRAMQATVTPEVLERTKTCAVCSNDLKLGKVATRLRCGHHFHTQCIHDSLHRNDQCPVCSTPVSDVRSRVDGKTALLHGLVATDEHATGPRQWVRAGMVVHTDTMVIADNCTDLVVQERRDDGSCVLRPAEGAGETTEARVDDLIPVCPRRGDLAVVIDRLQKPPPGTEVRVVFTFTASADVKTETGALYTVPILSLVKVHEAGAQASPSP